MVNLRLAVPMVIVAAIMAACITYLIAPPVAPSLPVVANQAPPTVSSSGMQGTAVPMRVDRLTTDEEKAVAAFQRAADAILKRAENLQASAPPKGLPINGKVPLPRKRPIPRS